MNCSPASPFVGWQEANSDFRCLSWSDESCLQDRNGHYEMYLSFEMSIMHVVWSFQGPLMLFLPLKIIHHEHFWSTFFSFSSLFSYFSPHQNTHVLPLLTIFFLTTLSLFSLLWRKLNDQYAEAKGEGFLLIQQSTPLVSSPVSGCRVRGTWFAFCFHSSWYNGACSMARTLRHNGCTKNMGIMNSKWSKS